MPSVTPLTRRDLLVLLLILFVAALMRLGEPGVVEFKLDEAWLSRLAQDWVAGGPLPLTGMPSSVGIPNPPVSVYLIALPYALGGDPLAGTLFVAALNVAGVGLVWLLAHRYLGRTAALVAALAYALNPWAVLYSRKIWAQDMNTPFLLAALLVSLLGFVEGRRWAQVLCLPLFIVAAQFHFATWPLLALVAALVWMGRRSLSWRALALSVILALLTLVPFGVGLSRVLADDPNRLARALTISAPRQPNTVSAVQSMAYFATGLGIETQIAPDNPGSVLAAVPAPAALWLLPGIVGLVGLITVWTPRYRPFAPLLTLWALVPVLVFAPRWTAVYPHYFITSLPVIGLLAGVGVAWLATRLPGQPISRSVVLTGFAAVTLSQGLWWRGLLRYVDVTPTQGFGTPLARWQPLQAALSDADDVIVLADNAELEHSQEAARWMALLPRARCLRALSGRGLILYPAGPFRVLVTPTMQASSLSDRYSSGETTEFTIEPADQVYTVVRHDEPMAPPDALSSLPPVMFSNGATLSGYAVEPDGVTLEWRLSGRRDENPQYFIHLLDIIGERVAQQDGPFLPGRYGCDNDLLITKAELDVPETARTLRVGLYTLERGSVVNASVLDAAGNPAASWYDIALDPQPRGTD